MTIRTKKTWKDMGSFERFSSVLMGAIIIGIVTGIPLFFIIAMIVGSLNPPPPSPFTANLSRSWAVDPSTRDVEYEVTNNDSISHAASCFVSVHNSTGSYKGSDFFSPGTLEAGTTKTFNALVNINDDGAAYITLGNVQCAID